MDDRAERQGVGDVWHDQPMTETGIVALVGVVTTLLSGLGAAWLTNRSARQRDLDQRASLLQGEIRALIVGILMTARGWGGSTAGLATGLALSTSKEQFSKNLLDLLNNSTSGKDFTRYGDELQTKLTDAKLLLAEGPLADVIDAMNAAMLRWWNEVLSPMQDNLMSTSPSQQARLKLATAHSEDWQALIRTLEETARIEIPRLNLPRVASN